MKGVTQWVNGLMNFPGKYLALERSDIVTNISETFQEDLTRQEATGTELITLLNMMPQSNTTEI